MALTFGATAGDAVSTPSLNWMTANSGNFFSCWVYPTTLTAGRVIWGDGGSARTQLEVATTTSQLTLRIKMGTTDAIQTLSHPDIPLTVNNWYWIGVVVVCSGGTSTPQTWGWIGTATQSPQLMTITVNQVGAGGFPAAATNIAIGQSSSLTAAWQGDIDQFLYMASVTGGSGPPVGSTNTASGGIDDRDNIFRRWIQPLWAGLPNQMNLAGNTTWRFRWHPLNGLDVYYVDWARGATPISGGAQIFGSVSLSSRRAPSICPQNWLYQALRKPRR